MISGAVYRDGIARTADGSPYVIGVASDASVPSTAVHIPGGMTVSPFARAVSPDGEIYVRYV